MKNSLEDAFRHFVTEIYPSLSPSEEKYDLRVLVSRFRQHGLKKGSGSLGQAKAIEILMKYGYSINYPKSKK